MKHVPSSSLPSLDNCPLPAAFSTDSGSLAHLRNHCPRSSHRCLFLPFPIFTHTHTHTHTHNETRLHDASERLLIPEKDPDAVWIDGCMNEKSTRWRMHACMHGCMNGRRDIWMKRCMNGRRDRWMGGRMDG